MVCVCSWLIAIYYDDVHVVCMLGLEKVMFMEGLDSNKIIEVM